MKDLKQLFRNSSILTFWSGQQLKAEIYPETISVLQKIREKGYMIAALTDLPSAMPDEIFRRDIPQLLGYFDYYVSSSVAGYRKPNCRGLHMISEKFDIPITELIFIVTTSCKKDSIQLQEGETIDYKWVSRKERIAFYDGSDCSPSLKERLTDFINSIRQG